MPKNIKEIMIALNQVLTTTVWVNEDRQIISLADELKIGMNNTPRSIEDLSRPSLVATDLRLVKPTRSTSKTERLWSSNILVWAIWIRTATGQSITN